MILTFNELAIDAKDYNGYSYATAHAEIVNIACDYMMLHFYTNCVENEVINATKSFTNFILQTVEIETLHPVTTH